MDLREIGWGSVDWIQFVQDRDWWRALVNTVMNLGVWRHGVSKLFRRASASKVYQPWT
jgi:hypothetical protein